MTTFSAARRLCVFALLGGLAGATAGCGGDDGPSGGDAGPGDGGRDGVGGPDGQMAVDGGVLVDAPPVNPGADGAVSDGSVAPDGSGPDGGTAGLPPSEPGPVDGPGCQVMIAAGDAISDFEGGGLAVAAPRPGMWSMNVDAYGSQIVGVAAGGACGSGMALRTQGATAEKTPGGTGEAYGAAVALRFAAPVDASAYSGIRFMAKGTALGVVRVMVFDSTSAPSGATCTSGACLSAHYTPVSIDGQWGPVEVKFSDLRGGTAAPAPLMSAAIVGFQIVVRAPPYGPFDLSIDNVAFVPR